MSCKWPRNIGNAVTVYRKRNVRKNKDGMETISYSYEIHPKIGGGEIEYTSDESKAMDMARTMADGLNSGTYQARQQIEEMTPGDVATWKEINRIARELNIDILIFMLKVSPHVKRLNKLGGDLAEAVEHWANRLSFPAISLDEAVKRYFKAFENQWSKPHKVRMKSSLGLLVERFGGLPLRDLSLKQVAEEKILWQRKQPVKSIELARPKHGCDDL